jgi:sodium-dependent phosphate cotransporter
MTADVVSAATPTPPSAPKHAWLSWLFVLFLIYVLLAAVGAIGDGFKMASGDNAKALFDFASNPIIALIIGIVTTALIQSSSTVTSVIVGLVAGGLPIHIAIPMIMGANIGTSLTSTLVSLGHIRHGEEFRRAFSAATIHDSFNLLAVALLLPIELLFKPLAKTSEWLAQHLVSDANMSMSDVNFMKVIMAPAMDSLKWLVSAFPKLWAGVILIVVGVALILLVVSLISKILRRLMVGRAKKIMHTAVGHGPVSGMASGTVLTMLVQSSSTTTSLIVPLAGTGVFSLKQIYPFTLGCNIGTTITALLAATAITGDNAVFALQIALVHLFFNIFGILLIYVLPILRPVPIYMAETLAMLAQRSKMYVVAYIGGVFFVVPLAVLGITQSL